MSAESAVTARAPFRHICVQHVDEIAQLWSIWNTAITLPHYDRPALAELEGRVQAHIAGVRMHGDEAWRVCQEALDIANAGEIFAAAHIAFRSYDEQRIKQVVEAVEPNPHLEPGLVSALAWLPGDIAHPWLKKFLDSKQMQHKTMALMACRLRGEDPADYLTRLLQRQDCLADAKFADIALRCVGEFKRRDLQPTLRQQLEGESEAPFAALFSAILLGAKDLAESLKTYVFSGPHQGEAIDLAFRTLPPALAQQWVKAMLAEQVPSRWVIAAAQALGDSQAIPWLIGLMQQPHSARLAGSAFYALTGIDLQEHELVLEDPIALQQKIEQELASDSAEMPNEEHLSWPDGDKIWHLWKTELAVRYPPGRRYLLGLPIAETNLKAVFAKGFQPQRRAAALELALMNTTMPLLNTFACAAPER